MRSSMSATIPTIRNSTEQKQERAGQPGEQVTRERAGDKEPPEEDDFEQRGRNEQRKRQREKDLSGK